MTLSLAYVVGILDGEGSIGLTKSKSGAWFPRVMVINTNHELLEALQEQFGGTIQTHRCRPSHWKQSYTWRLCYSKAAKFVAKVYPHLLIKYDQATCIMLWDAIRPGSKGGRWDQDCLSLLKNQLTWLNERGAAAQTTIDPMTAALPKGWKGK